MLQPSGFCQHSITTSLGTLVYYAATEKPWLMLDNADAFPTLVFLHGFGGGSSAYEWSKVYPAFAIDYRILAPDLLGWGRSHHLDRAYQIEDYLTTLTEFLEKCCSQPATVVASSLTAAFIVRVAINRPDLFKALILVAPAGLSDFGKPYKNVFAQLVSLPLLDRVIYSTAIATNNGIRGFLEQRQFARANRVSQEMVDAYLASAQQPNAEYSALSFVRGDLCFDLAEYTSQLTVPTALLWGKQAQFTEASMAERFADTNRSAIRVVQILDDAGLTPQLEVPAITIAMLRRFLVELGVEPSRSLSD